MVWVQGQWTAAQGRDSGNLLRALTQGMGSGQGPGQELGARTQGMGSESGLWQRFKTGSQGRDRCRSSARAKGICSG